MRVWARLLALYTVAVACAGQTAPSVLSRGLLPSADAVAASVFRPFAGVMSGYDNGPLTRDLERGEGPFHEIDGGIEARQSGERGDFRLDYRFGARYYPRDSRLDRTNHSLHLDTRLRLSRRVSLLLRNSGSSSSFGEPLEAQASALSSGFFVDGGPAVFHSRTLADTALADLAVMLSPRTSVAVGGDGFLVQHQHRGLADAIGWRARADLAHRYARYKTITFSYSFTHFDHTRTFGSADYDVWALGHSLRLGRHSELDLLGGVGRLRSAGIRAVELDNEIARLLGTARGAEIFRLRTWTPHVLAAWTQRIRRGDVRMQYSQVVTDGGGLSGVARQNTVSLTVGAPLGRSWRAAGVVVARTYRSLDTFLYDARTASAGSELARRLGSHVELRWRYQFSFHHFQRGLLRNFHRHELAAGVVLYPGDAQRR